MQNFYKTKFILRKTKLFLHKEKSPSFPKSQPFFVNPKPILSQSLSHSSTKLQPFFLKTPQIFGVSLLKKILRWQKFYRSIISFFAYVKIFSPWLCLSQKIRYPTPTLNTHSVRFWPSKIPIVASFSLHRPTNSVNFIKIFDFFIFCLCTKIFFMVSTITKISIPNPYLKTPFRSFLTLKNTYSRFL